jgi:membrane-associated phospholipid phosphatase
MRFYRKQIMLLLSILFSLASFTATAQNTDINILREINQGGNTNAISFTQIVSDTTSLIVFGTLFLLLCIGLIKKNIQLRDHSLLFIISVSIADGFSSLTKIIVQRQRPFDAYFDIIKYGDGGSYSFPSGHTTEAFAFATALALTYRKWYITVPAYLWAALVGFSRMHLGTHYPSDVLAGMVIGAGSSWLCYQAGKSYWKRKKPTLL